MQWPKNIAFGCLLAALFTIGACLCEEPDVGIVIQFETLDSGFTAEDLDTFKIEATLDNERTFTALRIKDGDPYNVEEPFFYRADDRLYVDVFGNSDVSSFTLTVGKDVFAFTNFNTTFEDVGGCDEVVDKSMQINGELSTPKDRLVEIKKN